MLRKILIVMALPLCFGCATERRVPTFKEAVAENPNLESGIYNRTNGENVQVTVQSLKAKIEELEKQLYDAHHETDYYKRQNDELQHENSILRVKGNYELERQSVNVEGFDASHNPIVTRSVRPALPKRAPIAAPTPVKAEPVSAIEPEASAPSVPAAPQVQSAPQAPAAPVAKADPPKAEAPKEAPKPAQEAPKAPEKAPEQAQATPSKPATELPKDTKAELAQKQ